MNLASLVLYTSKRVPEDDFPPGHFHSGPMVAVLTVILVLYGILLDTSKNDDC